MIAKRPGHRLRRYLSSLYRGKYLHSKISHLLDKMLYAANEEEFLTAYEAAQKIVPGKHLPYLQKYGQCPELYSLYKIQDYIGNMGRQRSVHAEQNHSSIVSRVGPSLLVEMNIVLAR